MINGTDRANMAVFVGRYAMKHTRTYPHRIERVWKAVSTAEGLNAWYVPHWTVEPGLGGAWSCTYGNASLDALEDQRFGRGVIAAWDPPRLVDYGGEHRFELTEVEGGTRLDWTQTYDPSLRFPKLEATMPDGNPGGPGYPMFPGGQAGNHVSADDLGDYLAGRPIDSVAGDARWVELTRAYHAHFLANLPAA